MPSVSAALQSIQSYFNQMGAGVQEETPISPYTADGTLGEGILTYSDPDSGEFEVIPYTGTPPFGEPPMQEAEASDAEQGFQGPGVPFTTEGIYDGPINHQLEDDMLHEQLHNVGQPRGYDIIEWVNPSNPGIPNLGPVNDQAVQTGDSQFVRHVSADEQGWGLDPAILLARYPHSENVNPYYASWTYRRNGTLEWVPSLIPYGEYSAINVQLQEMFRRRQSTVHGRLVDNPASVPYSTTVPIAGQAGPLNLIPEGDEAIY